MKTMRWGWVLLTLYTGVFALVVYWFLPRASARETPEPPLPEQSVESTIHCVAGDATGILLAAVVTIWLRLPMSPEVIVEYVAGFAVGLFVFQALCMKPSFDGSYWRAVKSTLLAETLSMRLITKNKSPVPRSVTWVPAHGEACLKGLILTTESLTPIRSNMRSKR